MHVDRQEQPFGLHQNRPFASDQLRGRRRRRGLLPRWSSSPRECPHCPHCLHCPHSAADPDPKPRAPLRAARCGSVRASRRVAIFSGNSPHFATLASRPEAAAKGSRCATHTAMHARVCVDYGVEDVPYGPLATAVEPGPFGIGQVGEVGLCVCILAASLTPPVPFFSQFPNGL
jgi:hypothetical protein